MALVKSGTFGSSPNGYYELYADQVSGSGTSRTVRVTLYLKVSGSSSSMYGYPLQWLPSVHYSNGGWQYVKGNEMWYGSDSIRTYTSDIGIDVGTTGSVSVGVSFQLRRTDGGSTSWNTTQSGSFTVGTTNSRPVISGSLTISPSGTIGENVSELQISIPTASDAENNLSGYRGQVSIDGGGYADIYSGSSNSFKHNISSYGEGTTLKYRCDAYDSGGLYSSAWAESSVITKNTLTNGSISSVSNAIDSDTNSITVNIRGGSNSDNSTVYHACYSDSVTVYNQKEITSGTSQTIQIWRSGAKPDAPYIVFSELRDWCASSSYQKTLHIGLVTRNSYGTKKYSSSSTWVDLRTAPSGVSSQTISLVSTESTAYRKVGFSADSYFIPDGSLAVRVKWGLSTGVLGEPISYELFVSYGIDPEWLKITDLSAGTTFYNHIIPKQNTSTTFKYLVRAKTPYGFYTDRETPQQTLHYYNPPTLSMGDVNRTGTQATVPVDLNLNTSIATGVILSGSWQRFARGTTTPVQQTGTLTNTQSSQDVVLTGLTESGQYDLKFTFSDNTGFSSSQNYSCQIGQNLSVFFVNKYGIGVGGAKANSTSSLVVDGTIEAINGGIVAYTELGANVNLNDIKTAGEYNQNANASTSLALNYPEAQAGHLTVTNGAGPQQRYQVYNTSRIYTRAQYNTGAWTPWARQYNTENKPSATDVGAVPTSDVDVAATPNEIVKRDGAADINCRLLKTNYPDQSTISGGLMFRVNNSTDSFSRVCNNTAAIRAFLGANPVIYGDHYTNDDLNIGFAEGILNLGGGWGLWFDWYTLTSTGSNEIHRVADVSPTIYNRIKAVYGQTISCRPGTTWGYVTGGYDHNTKKVSIAGADFSATSGTYAYARIMVLVSLNY